jgi:hypothetical protein
MTGDQLRTIALALPNTSEAPHFDRAAFRTPKRIFATLAGNGRSANLLLDADQQAALVESHPEAFAAIAGGWGRQGWTTMRLAEVSVAEAKAVLADAHALANVNARKAVKAERTRAAKPSKATKPAKPTKRKRASKAK